MTLTTYKQTKNYLTIDVEEWFHILDDQAVHKLADWDSLQARLPRNMERILVIMDEHKVKATMFWLGWAAQKHPDIVRQCAKAGH